MRVDEHNTITSAKSVLKYSKSSGIKEEAAVKIDAALSKLNIRGNASVKSETEKENRMELVYEITF